jgi:hypothetical protein
MVILCTYVRFAPTPDMPSRSLLTPTRRCALKAQELWYPPPNAVGRLNEAAAPQMALAARAERPRVLRLHTDLKIAPVSRGGPTS